MQPYSFTVHAAYSANASSANMPTNGSQVNIISAYFGTGVTFGSGTLTLESSPDNGTTWVSTGVTITTATASTFRQSNLVFGSLFRWTLTGATSPVLNLSSKLVQVRYGNVDSFTLAATGAAFATSSNSLPFVALGAAEYLLAPSSYDFNMQAVGTWAGVTLALQSSPDGGVTWFNETTLTANGYVTVATGLTGVLYRLAVYGGTAPALTVRVIK